MIKVNLGKEYKETWNRKNNSFLMKEWFYIFRLMEMRIPFSAFLNTWCIYDVVLDDNDCADVKLVLDGGNHSLDHTSYFVLHVIGAHILQRIFIEILFVK